MNPLKIALLLAIRAYKRLISPFLPPACRFYPTCSQYCAQAIERHPLHKALYLSLRRILSCQPWGRSGHDPVPD